MRADEFVTRRRPEWDRLEKLLQRAGTSRVGGLLPTEVLSLAGLYRRATADLARAKRERPTQTVGGYLKGLGAGGPTGGGPPGGETGGGGGRLFQNTDAPRHSSGPAPP